MDEGVVEGRLDVANTEHVVLIGLGSTTDDGGSVVGLGLSLLSLFSLGAFLAFCGFGLNRRNEI